MLMLSLNKQIKDWAIYSITYIYIHVMRVMRGKTMIYVYKVENPKVEILRNAFQWMRKVTSWNALRDCKNCFSNLWSAKFLSLEISFCVSLWAFLLGFFGGSEVSLGYL